MVGKPLVLHYKGSVVTVELLMSVIELNSPNSITNFLKDGISVLEIGAGYGRVAHLLLSKFPYINYSIVYIPQTLEISKYYLKTILPNAAIKFKTPEDFAADQKNYDFLLR